MALSGSITGSIMDGHYQTRIDWTATQDIGSNTSTITAKLYLVTNWALEIGTRTHTVTIDGTAYSITSGSISVGNGENTTYIGEVSKTVTHNSDGTKSLNISGSFDFRASIGSYGYVSSIESSQDVTLDTIPRISQITLSGSNTPYFGSDTVTVSTNRQSTSFTHHLYYSINGAQEVFIASDITDTYEWTLPADLMNQIPNSTTATITLRLYTFSGSTNIGSSIAPFTAYVPDSVKPTITGIKITDPNGYASKYNYYIQTQSKFKVTVTAIGAYSSTIKSYKIVANGQNYSVNGAETDVLTTAGTNAIQVSVTDSRGRTHTLTDTRGVLAYQAPTISKLACNRCDASGTADEAGEYINIAMIGSITALNDLNAKSFTLQYREQGASSWTDIITYTAYSLSATKIQAASSNKSYEVRLVAEDDFYSGDKAVTRTVQVGTGYTLIDFRNTGKGISFGKVSEKDAFECAMPAEFNDIAFTGKISGISIGAANLFTGSKNLKGFSLSSSALELTRTDDTAKITVKTSSTSNHGLICDIDCSKLEQNTDYTFSVYVNEFSNLSRSPHFSIGASDSSSVWSGITGGYIQLVKGVNSITFNTGEHTGYFRFFIGIYLANVDSYLIVSKAKLEKGNMPTDWTPALEDMNKIEVSYQEYLVDTVVGYDYTDITWECPTGYEIVHAIPTLIESTSFNRYIILFTQSITNTGCRLIYYASGVATVRVRLNLTFKRTGV